MPSRFVLRVEVPDEWLPSLAAEAGRSDALGGLLRNGSVRVLNSVNESILSGAAADIDHSFEGLDRALAAVRLALAEVIENGRRLRVVVPVVVVARARNIASVLWAAWRRVSGEEANSRAADVLGSLAELTAQLGELRRAVQIFVQFSDAGRAL